ncbi:helix-turn-helix domain-containing protein [Parapedobacter tibetensis]|uniref:helix-turn-helix domain-containing protein n=1 Tax=Parapedobacter tibetensis TaxID=2972951 RepID=UPI00214DEE3D|nr:transcriptional regulator [Parapedobacter tibetensis]
MELKIIKSEKEYDAMLDWVDAQFDAGVNLESEAGERLQMALLLIKNYEDEHYRIPAPDPLEAVRLKMQEQGLHNKDLTPWLGSKGYVSALLNGKKPLTLRIAKLLHERFGIPAEVFLV